MSDTLWHEITAFFTKWWAYIGYIAIGLMGKFGWDIYNKKQLSFWYVLGSGMIACFVGYLTSMLCVNNKWDNANILVPIATLLCEKIIMFIFANWKNWIKSLLEKLN